VSGPRVVVVGGGLAGIAAALECSVAGADVTLVEARDWLGGATFSIRRNGLVLDNGQHVFLRCCTEYTALLQRLGVFHLTSMQPRLRIPVLLPGGRRSTLAAASLPAPLHLGPSLLRYSPLRLADRVNLARAVLPMRRLDPADPALDCTTLAAWLAAHGQSPRALEALWNLIALPTLNLPADQASLAAAVKVFRTGLLDDRRAADIGVASVPLSRLHGEPARAALTAAGVDVLTGVRVRRLDRARDWQVGWNDGGREADAVILAVPHQRAGALLEAAGAGPQPYRYGLGSSPIVNIHLVLDRRVLAEPFAAALRSPLQWLFDRTRPAGLSSGQCLAASISAANGLTGMRRDEIARSAFGELRRLIPLARWARLEDAIVTRDPHATFRAVPGSAALRPGPVTALPGMFLAGAWTATGWPATMEGAVRSGVRAARAACAGPLGSDARTMAEAA